MKNKRSVFITIAILGVVVLAGITAFALVWNGVILLNNPPIDKYPVRGVDVSSYQGDIDWDTLAAQDISFAFIKATEGASFVDTYFVYNYEQAQKSGLRVGAYHFFSYDSLGKIQAENFIKTVPKTENMLPPVIDIEFYGDKEKNLPDKQETMAQLNDLIEAIESHYGMKPIIYATEKSYTLYIADAYAQYDIWIRNVITTPTLSDARAWTFWQYTNRAKLNGYKGEEQFIDINVFYGTESDFENYAK